MATGAEDIGHLLLPGANLDPWLFMEERAARTRLGETEWWWWFWRGWWTREDREH